VVREYPGVEHIGIGYDRVRFAAYPTPQMYRRIAVVNAGLYSAAERRREFEQTIKVAQLVLTEGFSGVQEKS
jgi:predicted kinase